MAILANVCVVECDRYAADSGGWHHPKLRSAYLGFSEVPPLRGFYCGYAAGYRCIPLLATGFTAARDIPQADVGYTTERETDKPQDDNVDTTSIWLVSRRAAVLQRTYGKRSLRSAAVGRDAHGHIGGIAVALFGALFGGVLSFVDIKKVEKCFFMS